MRPSPSLLRRRPAAALLAALLLAVALPGCAALPAKEDVVAAPPPPASRTALAERIAVQGGKGRAEDAAERARTIAELEAEGAAGLLRHHLAVMSADGPVELVRGNAAKLLVDGPQTFAALFAEIDRARRTIWFETYILEDEGLAQRLAELLLKKRAQGVAVQVLVDGVGSIGTDEAYFDRLRDGGVLVCRFNPVKPTSESRWNPLAVAHRDHRKITVVDGRVAFVGGINVSRVYASGSGPGGSGGRNGSRSADEGWRDTHMALRGPIALPFEQLVRESWTKQKCQGELPPPSQPAPAAGERVVRLLASSPDGRPSEIYRALLGSIAHARRSVHLTMAYFAPGDDMIETLAQAARRGVDVHLVLPSVSDFEPVLHAGRARYQELLDAGVKIAELQDAVLHAKTAVIDGVWSTVGSSNLDWRSFVANDEVNAIVLGEDFAGEMEALFQRDLRASQPIEPQAWAHRPVGQRLKQWLARITERFW